MRQREDDVKIRDRQKLVNSRLDPVGAGKKLTLRTVAVAARVVGSLLVTATAIITSADVTAELGCATIDDVLDHFGRCRRQWPESVAVISKEVRHLQPWPHARRVGTDCVCDHWMSGPDQKSCDGIQWAFYPDLTHVTHMSVDLGTADGRVAKQDLDHANVHAAF